MFIYNVYVYLYVNIWLDILYRYVIYVICTLKNIIFDISISDNMGISNIYTKKKLGMGVRPQVNIFERAKCICIHAYIPTYMHTYMHWLPTMFQALTKNPHF